MTLTQQLRQQIAGRLIAPDDPEYEKLRRGWNLTIDQRPALILVPENAQDVVAGVNFARENDLAVAAQSTGHGVHAPADGKLLVVTSEMNAFDLDAASRTVRADAGVIWEPVLAKAAEHGLAPLVGTSAHVGIVGYSLGGGLGWLARKYGLAADSVQAIDVVTADGVLRHADANENADLFWGLRGGRGGLGIVTALTCCVYPVASVYGGTLAYPGALFADALRFFREWTTTLPDELTSKISLVKFPSAPFIPEAIRGKTEVFVRAVYAGDAATGAKLMQPWLDWNAPTSNDFRQMPFPEVAEINADPVNPSPGVPTSELFDRLSDEAIDILVRHGTDPASPVLMTEIRHAGGAIARVNPDANAVSHRDVPYYLTVAAPAFTPDIHAAILAAFVRLKDDLRPYVNGGVYINFMIGAEARDRARDAFSPHALAKLGALKAKYDPGDVFRFGGGQLIRAPA